ncbi:hypothetical protein J6590_004957 [Homalodisca vitripennis]|nr:hypothetical protein J6590_004957 [Homalodisca vitripennis]
MKHSKVKDKEKISCADVPTRLVVEASFLADGLIGIQEADTVQVLLYCPCLSSNRVFWLKTLILHIYIPSPVSDSCRGTLPRDVAYIKSPTFPMLSTVPFFGRMKQCKDARKIHDNYGLRRKTKLIL